MDLSLVPIEDLFEELKKRSDHAVMAVCSYQDGGTPIVHCFNSKKSWMHETGLAEILKNHVLNNFSGEIDKIHELIAEENNDE